MIKGEGIVLYIHVEGRRKEIDKRNASVSQKETATRK